tara:strand:- start:266 stop:904 length:639 start_codon:yes stop_codon:yes gene_type:complete
MSLTVLDKGALDKGVDQLILSDPGLKPLFDAYDVPELKIEKNYFWALCRSIIYQQISGKAASTIAKRFLELFPSGKNIRPLDIIEINIDKLHLVGLSKQKASYIKNIANAFYNGEVDVDNYFTMNDEDIITDLIKVKGVGKWTAEMFLLFTLRRPDIFPVTDLGVQKGFQIFYSLDEIPTIDFMNQKAERWRPYRSIVTLHLWYAVEGPFEW